MSKPTAPAPPTSKADTFFDLSFRGGVPDILRAIADRIEQRDGKATSLNWALTESALKLVIRLDLQPKE